MSQMLGLVDEIKDKPNKTEREGTRLYTSCCFGSTASGSEQLKSSLRGMTRSLLWSENVAMAAFHCSAVYF